MSKKVSIIIIAVMIVISLAVSIYIPNRDKIKDEKENESINYYIIESNGKKGVAEENKTLIEPQYEEIIIPNSHRAVFYCENENTNKFVNDKNEEIFKDYDSVELICYDGKNYEKNILKYEKEGKYGILSITGNPITENKYEELTSIGNKDGEVLVKENGKYGIIDEKGKTKIKCKYDLIESDEFYTDENGYKKAGYVVCITTNDGYRYGYFDSDGVQVLEEKYNQITRLTEIKNNIYLIASENGQCGVFINNTKIINTQYQSINYNSDLQIFIVERTGIFGAINLKGTQVIPLEYNELQINGIYIYGIKELEDGQEEKKVLDVDGNVVNIPFDTIINTTASSKYFIENEAGVYYILNSNFEKVSSQNYQFLEYAYDTYFIATNEQNKVGVIDIEENIIIEFEYDLIQVIKGKFIIQAVDFSNNTTNIYDKQFDLALEMSNANIEILDDGIRVYNTDKEEFLDDNGKIITK